MTKNSYIETLNTRIDTLNSSIQNLSERRDHLIAERDETMQQVFEAETGLHYRDELEVTSEFVEFENARGNLGTFWIGGDKLMRVYSGSAEYFKYGDLRVEQGSASVGGVPVDLVQRMRKAWLLKHEPDAKPAQ